MELDNVMQKKNNDDKRYEDIIYSWQRHVINAGGIVAVLAFFIEIIFMFMMNYAGQMSTTWPKYILIFILRPTIVNILAFLICRYYFYQTFTREDTRKLIPLIMMTIIIVNLMITHLVFPVIYCGIIIPLFMSVIYGDPALSRKLFIFLNPVYILTVMGMIYLPTTSKLPSSFNYNVILGYVSLWLSYYIVNNIVKFEKKKELLLDAQASEKDELREAVLYDGLTGIYNHSGLFERLEEYVKNFDARRDMLCMAIIDIDFFKRVNDDFGHEVGNVVLRRIGALLKGIESSQIDVARYGGEEFAICGHGIAFDELMDKLESVHDEFGKSTYDGIDRPITFSAGVARFKGNGQTISEFIDTADKALYEAKENGRNRIVVWRYS
ncbi:MAG: GGDEF domain-containing protein [Lachnospiraceae bacterium]|nr:GGDEF domain-containing protein [Lachnospiraceae bacterium]